MRKVVLCIVGFALGALSFAQLPAGFTDTPVVTGLSQPDAMAFAPDGRIFVAQKTGAIKVVVGGQVVSTFTTINTDTFDERGVLGLAFDPDFSNHPYLYVYYTTNANSLNPPPSPKNRVSRFTVNGNVAVNGSEVILLDDIASDAGNHNAGCLRFAPDGTLYISTGDGGQFHTNSQNLTNLSGKILRINKDGSIPNTNPFFGSLSDRNEIFVYGLRNPFRFSFRPGTSTLYIGDVGENTWEEVNVGVPGGNYGWNTYEGPTNVAGFISPAFYYMHTNTQSAAIVGGLFMAGKRFAPPYDGSYFYGDYIRNVIRRVVFNSSNVYVADFGFTNANTPVDFAEGPDGALYYVSINQGSVRRIVYKATLNGLSLSPTTVTGGNSSAATVSLDNPAPAAGALIALSSTAGATVPSSVRIPGGATSVQFPVTTATRSDSGSATITATRIGVTLHAVLTINPGGANATFVSQSVPTSMLAGHTYAVSVTMHNSGGTTWTYAGGYRLLSYNPSGNKTWGFDRMYIASGTSVTPGSDYTFMATVTAPLTPGRYNFQCRMLLNGIGTFGQPSANVVVSVS